MTAAITSNLVSSRIILTQAAEAKVAELLAAEADPNLRLRVFARGGGCDGFEYGFEFDDVAGSNDLTVTKGSVALLIDAMS